MAGLKQLLRMQEEATDVFNRIRGHAKALASHRPVRIGVEGAGYNFLEYDTGSPEALELLAFLEVKLAEATKRKESIDHRVQLLDELAEGKEL